MQVSLSNIINAVLGFLVFAIGVANLIFVHPVPGLIALLLSLLYLPITNEFLNSKFGFRVPFFIKVLLGVVVIWFTLGVSDLGDMID